MGCGSSAHSDSWGPPETANGNRPTDNPKVTPIKSRQITQDTTTGTSGAGTKASTTRNPKSMTMEQNKSGKQSWRDILTAVSLTDPWAGVKREDRSPWREKLEEAERLVQGPRRVIPEEMVLKVLCGDSSGSDGQHGVMVKKSKVAIFISSTFTDTQAERNLLIRDVYPYLRKLCRNLGLDFGTVDMRWGVKEEMTMEHGTTAMCLNEVERCMKESAGPAFLSILGHKYGYRTLPATIEKTEFEKLIELLKKQSGEFRTVENFYQLDNNIVPAAYILKPRKSDDNDWWNREKEVVRLFRTVAENLGKEAAEKYFISITEQEIHSGFLENPMHCDQVISLRRELKGIREDHHLHRHMIDMKDGKIDADAQTYLETLKEKKIPKVTSENDILLDFEYKEDEQSNCTENVMVICDVVCGKLVEIITKAYKDDLHVEENPIFDEVIQHLAFAQQKSEVFVGRENLIKSIHKCIIKNNGLEKQVLTVHGRSGCGKTALMSVVAKSVKETGLPSAVLVLRFLGTTSASGSARAVLYSICSQIARVYHQDTKSVPTNYGDLIKYFHESLNLATAEKPLVVILDSLDQLTNEDFGQNLKWLSLQEKLPKYAHVIVSTIPGGCLTTLKAYLPTGNLTEVLDMTLQDGPLILEKMLAAHNRTVTSEQKEILLNAFSKCPLPLYLRLAVDIAIKWHSYDVIPQGAIAPDMPGLIRTLFERLESKYGLIFVQHALAYITCAKDGLSVAELEDVLSCDDDVLDEIFDFWLPPFRRIPQLLWIRVRNELGMYLVERGTNGVNAYGWYHRQFWETAESRYLEDNDKWGKIEAHQAMADYFDGKWAEGKLWTPKKITRAVTDLTPRMENRQVPHQPLVISGSRNTGRQLNSRKLSELPHHLIKIKDWKRLEESVTTLEFIEAKFEANQGYDCRSVFLQAAREAASKKISSFSKFVGLGLTHFLQEPVGVYQLAAQQVKGTDIRNAFDQYAFGEVPCRIMHNQEEESVADPCDMTLMGHTNGIRCVKFHPEGNFIASSSEDGSLRFWDAFSGAEIVTVTGLPGPRYPALAGSYNGERPCVWDRTGKQIITGSEDGGVQAWDTNGAQLLDITPHTAGVTGVDVSPDNNLLATASKDGTVKIWNLVDFTPKTTMDVGHCLDCVFSPDGSRLAVSIYGQAGLYVINCSDGSIISVGSGSCNLNICVDWSPRGTEIVTAGDNSTITVWDPNYGQITRRLVSHRAWIWCIHYNSDGTRLLSCSSDRTIKLWDMDFGTCIATLGGHSHRVTGASFRPNTNDKFVTSSYDLNLKVWDYEAVAAGKVPEIGGLHYIILVTSPCGRYHASCQGWSRACTFYESEYNTELGTSCTHDGTILDACFTPDSTLFISVDIGHTGAYEEDVARRAHVKVCNAPTGGGEIDLGVPAPYAVAANNDYIAVGNIDGEVVLFGNPDLEKVRSWSISSVSPVDITTMTCSLTENIIAVGTQKFVSVWNMSDGSLVAKLPGMPANVVRIPFTPSSHQLLVGLDSGEIHVYNAKDKSYKQTSTLEGHTSKLVDMAFSLEGGEFLATAAVDMSLRVWNVAEGYTPHSVFYAPCSAIGFTDKNTVMIGESTGNKKSVQFKP